MKRFRVARDAGKLSAPGVPAIETPTVRQYCLDGRFHRPDGPAVEGARGTRLWYWRGVRVPRACVEDPRSLDVAGILAISNVEVRRCWLETYGLEDALLDLGRTGKARVVDQTTDPERRLWEIHGVVDVDQRHPRYVQVLCPTGRTYFLRVHPDCATAQAAVAWTFDLHPADYAPARET